MLKIKPNFKEDNILSSLDDNNSSDMGRRGRQLESDYKKIKVFRKSRESKAKNFKLTNKIKRILKSKIAKEESESSSDSLYKYKKRKVLYDYEKEINELHSMNFLDLESNDEEENMKLSMDFKVENEEIISNEIEKVLLDIYNANILSNVKSRNLFLTKYEKNISVYSLQLNKHYNLFILQILSDKLKELVKRCKEKLFEIPEIKKFKVKIQEKHATTVKRLDLLNKTKEYLVQKDEWKNVVSKIHFTEDSFFVAGLRTATQKKEEYHQFLNSCKIFLGELIKIKNCLLEFSKDLAKIFQTPLVNLNRKDLDVTRLVIEEFSLTLIEDDAMSSIFSQIRNFIKKSNTDELEVKILLSKIEGLIEKCEKKEITNFSENLIESINSCISDIKLEPDANNEILSIPTSASGSAAKSEEIIPGNIDDLVEYIACEVEEKKTRKKNRRKKKNIDHNTTQYDSEVERFKLFLKEESMRSSCVKKIKPKFSENFFQNLR